MVLAFIDRFKETFEGYRLYQVIQYVEIEPFQWHISYRPLQRSPWACCWHGGNALQELGARDAAHLYIEEDEVYRFAAHDIHVPHKHW